MQIDLVVAGAGISGLCLASRAARQGWSVRVYEARQRAGGCIDSRRFVEADGFWLELGAHTLFNSYGHLIDHMRAAGVMESMVGRRRLPFHLWENDAAVPPLRRLAYWRALLGIWRLPFLSRHGITTEAYYRRLLGGANYERLIAPALEAIASQPVDAMPADHLFRRKPRRPGLPRSFTLEGGLQTLVEGLGDTPGLRVETGQPVQRIVPDGSGFYVRLREGQLRARAVALAIPAAEAARVLEEALPELADPLRQLSSASVESLGVVAESDAIRLRPVAGLIGVRQPFYSMVSRDVVPHPHYRGFTFHFRPGQLDGGAQRVVAGRVLGLAPDRFIATAESSSRLPAPDLRQAKHLQRLLTDRGQRPLALAGNWIAGLSLEECAAWADSEFDRLATLIAEVT